MHAARRVLPLPITPDRHRGGLPRGVVGREYNHARNKSLPCFASVLASRKTRHVSNGSAGIASTFHGFRVLPAANKTSSVPLSQSSRRRADRRTSWPSPLLD